VVKKAMLSCRHPIEQLKYRSDISSFNRIMSGTRHRSHLSRLQQYPTNICDASRRDGNHVNGERDGHPSRNRRSDVNRSADIDRYG
jgi:hypothetical protein